MNVARFRLIGYGAKFPLTPPFELVTAPWTQFSAYPNKSWRNIRSDLESARRDRMRNLPWSTEASPFRDRCII